MVKKKYQDDNCPGNRTDSETEPRGIRKDRLFTSSEVGSLCRFWTADSLALKEKCRKIERFVDIKVLSGLHPADPKQTYGLGKRGGGCDVNSCRTKLNY